MVSRQTCEVRRRLPHEVHFCAPKRNCLNCIMEARGVTQRMWRQEAPTAEVGAFACWHADRAWLRVARRYCLHIGPLDC
jgi:hypothetical protein